MDTLRIYHFHNGAGGGVLSVIRNLLRFSRNNEIENHVIYTIDKAAHPNGYVAPGLQGAASETIFYYSQNWNFYHTCHQLAKLLPDRNAIIVAHDWIELGMASCLGLPNPVVQFLHGDYPYYYELAEKHQNAIDVHIAVSRIMAANLKTRMPHRSDAIFQRYFPVPEVPAGLPADGTLHIIYVVRDINDKRKNFRYLPAINRSLMEKGTQVHWTLTGSGLTDEEFRRSWGPYNNYTYLREVPNEQLLGLLASHQLFVLPSVNEGFPVTVVEAMKAGCVPLISEWGGATSELIIEGETGFYFNPEDAEGYAATITRLAADRTLLEHMSANACRKANELFNPYNNAATIEDTILLSREKNTEKKREKIYGSRLDQPWIPNFLTQIIRSLNIAK